MLCISWKVYWEVVMAELFSWLSETPIATNIVMIAFVVLIIAFVLAVVITVIACIRGQPISIGGLRFGPEPRPWMVQDGAENIPADDPKKREFYEGTYEGRRTILVPVTFDPPFKKIPSASSSLNFGVEPLQFHARVFDAELPIDASLFGVRLVGPGRDFGL